MKNIQTPSQRFMAVRLETTGSFERNLKSCGDKVHFILTFLKILV